LSLYLEHYSCHHFGVFDMDTKIGFFSIDPGIYVLFSPGHIFGVCAKGAPEFTLGFYWGSCYSVFCFMCNLFVDRFLSFLYPIEWGLYCNHLVRPFTLS
jgi:hypothetical protein